MTEKLPGNLSKNIIGTNT